MNSRELVDSALRGESTPRVPTGPLAVHFCAGVAGCTLRDYSTSARLLAESVLRYYERFRPDAVWISADTWISAEAMGARVVSEDPDQPISGRRTPLVRTATDLDRIPAPDVGSQGRYPLMLEALSRVNEAIGRDVAIVGCFDQYPFSLAAALMGIERLMVRLQDDPAMVMALMDRCGEYAIAYGTAMAAAGAHILSGGDSPAGLIGPKRYEAIALPAERHVISSLKMTRRPVALHICGDTRRLLPMMSCSGADILELDHAVDLGQACEVTGPGITLWGNLDPVGMLLQGTPAQVHEASVAAVSAVRARGHQRMVLSSGCALAVGTPAPNLEALIAAGAA